MRNFFFISAFSNLIKEFTSISILDKAKKKNVVNYEYYNLFDYSNDSNNSWTLSD